MKGYRIDLHDEGGYSCRVRNDAGESHLDYTLSVLTPPEILILDKDKNRFASCSVYSFFIPSLLMAEKNRRKMNGF